MADLKKVTSPARSFSSATAFLRSVLAPIIVAQATAACAQQATETISIKAGELSVLFRDNSQSPKILSGLQSLFNSKHAPDYDAFDPDGRGSSAGLNFEHIIAGHSNPNNKFTPRHGTYTLHSIGERTVELRRKKEDSPWAVSSTLRYTVVPPHYVDFEFRCTPHDASKFGKRGYAIFFWADYMNQVDSIALNFRGVEREGDQEKWIAGDAPQNHPDYVGGGTYRHLDAKPLEYDSNHNFKLNVWSYDWPRYTQPFYVGRAANGMTLTLMFDRTYTTEDEIRFSLFKFKVKDENRRPAWDFQYVIHNVQAGKEYGYKGRLIWKKFVSYDDCLQEYQHWSAAD